MPMSHLDTQRPPPTASPAVGFEFVVYARQTSTLVQLPAGSTLVLGRGSSAAIRLEDASVSRQHLRIYVGEFVEVGDLGSSNGTALVRGAPGGEDFTASNRPLTPGQRVRVRTGDVLRVGSVLLVLKEREHGSSNTPPPSTNTPILCAPEMRRAYDLIKRAAVTDISVLLLGETGVGKEIMAESLHRHSARSDRPLLRLNCAAFTDSLLESELFGHERGAFTGAHAAKVGLLESTSGGTVFLDEIGELPLGTQAKMLRVLEERTVIRVGATRPRHVDVRFVTATNRDLSRLVKSGEFRSDLYYRISGLVVEIPPLRRRTEEIPLLVDYFLREFCSGSNKKTPRVSEAALRLLREHGWPGNVRELRNVIERAALLTPGDVVEPEHVLIDAHDADVQLLDADFEAETGVSGRAALVAEAGDERTRIVDALKACGGNQTRAAKLLGVSRRTLINRLDAFDLPRPKKH
jgi:transcriptional regulator with PAS, ATPase and Fis domain